MKINSEKKLIEALNCIEIHILRHALDWKLMYSTPYDFIQLIIQRIKMDFKLNKENILLVKTNKITEYVFLSIFLSYFINYLGLSIIGFKDSHIIAYASLLAALKILKEFELYNIIIKQINNPELLVINILNIYRLKFILYCLLLKKKSLIPKINDLIIEIALLNLILPRLTLHLMN